MNQGRLMEEAGIRVQAMGINAMKEQSAALTKLLQSAQTVTDPRLGGNVNIVA